MLKSNAYMTSVFITLVCTSVLNVFELYILLCGNLSEWTSFLRWIYCAYSTLGAIKRPQYFVFSRSLLLKSVLGILSSVYAATNVYFTS